MDQLMEEYIIFTIILRLVIDSIQFTLRNAYVLLILFKIRNIV